MLVGYGAVFYVSGKPGTQFDLFGDGDVIERIRPGAFSRALREKQDVRGLFNHSPDGILGRVAAGTMRLSVDATGLKYQIDLAGGSPLAQHVAAAVSRGDLSGSSFSFRPRSVTWEDDGAAAIRWLDDLDLFDVGPVTFPAYTGTSAELSKSGDRSAKPSAAAVDVDFRFREVQASEKRRREAEAVEVDYRFSQIRQTENSLRH